MMETREKSRVLWQTTTCVYYILLFRDWGLAAWFAALDPVEKRNDFIRFTFYNPAWVCGGTA